MRVVLAAAMLVALVGCLALRPTDRAMDVSVSRAAAPGEGEPTDALALAAKAMQAGDNPTAIQQLKFYLRDRPNALMVRAYLAELHYRNGDVPDAVAQYERFTRQASTHGSAEARKHRVHGHTRLMELAATQDDEAAEALHRGIGLVLLVLNWEADGADVPAAEVEAALCQAQASLHAAAQFTGTQGHAWGYLAAVYHRLGQLPASRNALARCRRDYAEASIPPDVLLLWPTD